MWVEVFCWIYRVWSSNECACCACDKFCLYFCMSEGISSFKRLRAGSQVLLSLCYVVSLCDFA